MKGKDNIYWILCLLNVLRKEDGSGGKVSIFILFYLSYREEIFSPKRSEAKRKFFRIKSECESSWSK